MLANPSEFHHSVAGVPTPTATHPTFPPQVPQTGAHNAAVTAATQVRYFSLSCTLAQSFIHYWFVLRIFLFFKN